MGVTRWCHLRCYDKDWLEIRELMEEDLTLEEAPARLMAVVEQRLGQPYHDDETGADGRIIFSVDLEVQLG